MRGEGEVGGFTPGVAVVRSVCAESGLNMVGLLRISD